MLSRHGTLPSRSQWSFELKWDGFRAIVSTEDGLHVRSRRGWNMTTVLPELRKLPTGPVLDGELVAWKSARPGPGTCAWPMNYRRLPAERENWGRRARRPLSSCLDPPHASEPWIAPPGNSTVWTFT
jgi:hypothetical protein